MNIKTILADAAKRLNNNEATIEAQLLLQHILNVNRAWLIAHQNDALEANIHAAYRALVLRRLNGEPIAYILGYREFYGLNLKVTADTLIPRPDTETLVEAALAKIPKNDNTSFPSFPRRRESMLNLDQKMDSRLRGNDEISDISENAQPLHILDLGTGTGAIALAIAKHAPHTFVTATDASQAALDIAIENAQNLKITNVNFILSDWFSSLKDQKFDVIVSNPPYIEQNDAHLNQGDLPWEPVSALVSGADGLDDIKKIITQAPQHLNPHGWLMLEHGYNQAERVAALLKQAGFSEISHAQDLAGIARVTFGRIV
jgi:release factor glutamine methyltransferase